MNADTVIRTRGTVTTHGGTIFAVEEEIAIRVQEVMIRQGLVTVDHSPE